MSDVNKELIGTWNVAFNQYRWTYTFAEGGKVTWRDPGNGKSGNGTWKVDGATVAITWLKSTTRETWNLPINPTNQLGQVTSDYANGWFSATKDQTRFDGFSPEGQVDAFACWAACLSWYTKVLPDIATIPQLSIINASNPAVWAADGSISMDGLMMLSLANVYLRRSRIAPGDLAGVLNGRKSPVLIGFGSGPLGGHVNVIHSFDSTAGMVGVMEPWFPDPETNRAYEYDGDVRVYYHTKTREPFKFSGIMVRRPPAYYTSRPLAGQLLVGARA